MRLAVIDTGTNVFHLSIVEKSENGFQKVFKNMESVRLGENGITTNAISKKSFERGVAVFKMFKRICDVHQVQKIIATGTAALRLANNANDFLAAVKTETGITIQIISGDDEAKLIWNGVKHALDIGLETSVIIDIGGGSVEFIIGNKADIFWKQSLNIGVTVLIEKYKIADPITATDILNVEAYLNSMLQDVVTACAQYQPKLLIGSSGSFETFASLIGYQFYDEDVLYNQTSYTYELADYSKIHQQLLNSTQEQRLAMKGMLPMRADMIVMASLVLNFVIKKLNISEMKLATYSLKEGMICNYFDSVA